MGWTSCEVAKQTDHPGSDPWYRPPSMIGPKVIPLRVVPQCTLCVRTSRKRLLKRTPKTQKLESRGPPTVGASMIANIMVQNSSYGHSLRYLKRIVVTIIWAATLGGRAKSNLQATRGALAAALPAAVPRAPPHAEGLKSRALQGPNGHMSKRLPMGPKDGSLPSVKGSELWAPILKVVNCWYYIMGL